jgi:hypothetical protein
MPKKTTLYLLFPLVVIIWGIVIYKVVGAFGDEKIYKPAAVKLSENEIKREKKDTFSLLPIDRDPFLGHYYKKPVTTKPTPVSPERKVEWPEISYLGLITDSGNSSEVHILQVNGKQILIQKSGIAGGIKLIGSKPGKVTLYYRGTRKTFSKAN